MPVIEKTLQIAHTPENLIALVSDIAKYPDFIRWITAMRVSREREEDGVRHALGEAIVSFKGFREQFSTKVETHAEARHIKVELVRGPFRKLENRWRFRPLPNGKTEVTFFIDYEFRNIILAMLARNNFDKAVQRIMEAFITEANKRYVRVGDDAD